MALSLLPHFMTFSLKQKGEDREVMILAATSGDTGKAALEGFKDVEGTCIKVFYPIDGVSPIQKQQMITQTGKNVDVIGIRGNFDDAQTAVKKAFNSQELKALCDEHHVFLSSANSINIGRLIPQIVYYFYSYFTLVKEGEVELGEAVNFTIPSGNFGNCLAGYIAKEMGLPIQKFIIASNKNNILTDFFKTGEYDANREFYKTNAPAMDILVSSNLERLVYFLCQDASKVKKYMDQLNETGKYIVDEDVMTKVKENFKAGWLNENQVLETIGECYKETGYLLDTHTAVGYGVYKQYQKESQVMVGPMTRKCAETFFVDKFFIGTDGFSEASGFTGNDYMRSETVRDMAKQAAKVIVVTESSKFNHIGNVNLLPTKDVACVVSDDGIPSSCEQYLLEQNVMIKKVAL